MKNYLVNVICLASFLTLASCNEDDADVKGGQQSKGVVTCSVDGKTWTAGKIQKQEYNPPGGTPSIQFTAYSDSDASLMYFSFQPGVLEREYRLGADFELSIVYYPNQSTSEDANEGTMVVSKYTVDSLVATFDYKTPKRAVTSGRIKIKHN